MATVGKLTSTGLAVAVKPRRSVELSASLNEIPRSAIRRASIDSTSESRVTVVLAMGHHSIIDFDAQMYLLT